jgi:hypothetical protein
MYFPAVWRGRMADVWKSIRTLVSILLYHAPILLYSICLTCKHCYMIEFTPVPRSTRPVQGSRPEVPPRDLAPYSHKVASGLFSHQNLEIMPHDLTLFAHHFCHILTLIFHHFRTLRLGTLFQTYLPIFVRPLPGSPTHYKNLRTGRSPLPQWATGWWTLKKCNRE